jgi:hypothetical protein
MKTEFQRFSEVKVKKRDKERTPKRGTEINVEEEA